MNNTMRLVLALTFAFVATGTAATFNVPAAYPTIQAGIDAAAAGDTILVAADTYTGIGNREVVLGVVDKVLLSASGPEVTVIDCENLDNGIIVGAGATAATLVRGFTITRATGGNGAGIIVDNAAATIENCRVTDCHAGSNAGGIYVGYSTDTVQITSCLVAGCSALYRAGGIMIDHGAATVTDCLIFRNSSELMGGSALFNNSSTVAMTGCTMAYNETLTGEGCVHSHAGDTDINNCIMAFSIEGTAASGSSVCDHCLSFGNQGGDDLGVTGENIYLDPHFCDDGADDYTLCANSPGAAGTPGNPWGERVGALVVGCAACAPAPNENLSWGELKTMYDR